MKRFAAFLSALVFIVMLSASALAQSDDRTLSISGSASVSLSADTVKIQIGVENQSENVADAQKENSDKMNAVIAALKVAGVDEKSIITSNFSVNSVYHYNDDGSSKLLGYKVSNTLEVTVKALDTIGAVIDAATQAGANEMYGLTFSSSEENAAYQKALTRAVEDAYQKALVLCQAANITLGDVKTVDASTGNTLYGVSNSYMYKTSGSADAAIVSGDVSVSATVNIVYYIK